MGYLFCRFPASVGLFFFCGPFWLTGSVQGQVTASQDYNQYHQQVHRAEQLIISGKYSTALQAYEQLFREYAFVFRHEYQIATQLALFIGDTTKAVKYLKKGIQTGWTIKSIRQNTFLAPIRKSSAWQPIRKAYPDLHKEYEAGLNQGLRKQVKKMLSKDQWKAFGALFTLSSKAQDRYAEKRFAPHSEIQMAKVQKILTEHGYPGERLIGNNFWMSTILSHHNSISKDYAKQDPWYPTLKPLLKRALKQGQVSPFEIALIDEWYHSTLDDANTPYGILKAPSQASLHTVNRTRANVGLRSVETRNKLIDVQKMTGMEFYLEGGPWIDGKIVITSVNKAPSSEH